MNIHVECTSSNAAASTDNLDTQLHMIWAGGTSALTGYGGPRSNCAMTKEQQMRSVDRSRREEADLRSDSTRDLSSTVVTSTPTTTPAFTLSISSRDMGVTQGCRQYINDECKEEKRQYFLQQQCPQCMSWVRICGSGLPAMASFEEAAANSLRTSRTFLNVIAASSGNVEDPRDSITSTRHRSGGESAVPQQTANLDGSGNNVDVDSEVVLQPPARFGHTAVLYKDSQILIFGGKSSEEKYFNDVYQYDASARRWICLQEECTDEVAAEVIATGQGSVSPSYVSAPPASPSFSSPTAPFLASTRWAEAAAVADAPSPHYSSGSVKNSGSEESSAAQRCATTSRDFAAHVQQSTVVDGALAGSFQGSVSRECNSLSEAGRRRRRRPAGRVGHAAALYQDTMYILSGVQLGRYFDDMWALDIPSLTWNKECGLPFSPRKGHTMHLLPADFTATRAHQDMLVVFGGLVKASRVRPRPADPELPTLNQGDPGFACAPTNAVLLYYPKQRRWCQLKTCGEQPAARFYHVSQLITGTALLLVFGGRSATPAQTGDGTAAATESAFLNDLHILDVSTGFWRQIRDVTGDIPSPRMCAASVFVNDTFGVFAGGGDTYCEDAFEFSLQTRRWRRLKPENQPACSRPTVTYTKDRLIFFGGFAPRTGVTNCTMELCLSPLSLKSQCLLWWNRCVFEKHIRSCTKSRAAEMEEKATAAAAAAAMERSGSGWCIGCGGQVTLQCSPAATAHSSPIATPRSWGVNRGFHRPAPLRVPSFEQSGTLSAAATAWGGGPQAAQPSTRGALTLSPTPSYSPSSPAVFSPLASGSKLTPWSKDTVGNNANVKGGGAAHAWGCGGAPTAFCSPASISTAAHNLFPSRPGTVMNSSCNPSQAGSPATVSTATSTSQAHLWSYITSGSIICGGGNSNSAIAHSSGNTALAVADADVVTGVADGRRRCSLPSPTTSLTHSATSSFFCPVSSPHTEASGRSLLQPPVAVTGEQPTSAGFITNCARHLGGYVAASFPLSSRCNSNQAPPRAHAGGPSPAAAFANSGRRGGSGGASSGSWCFSLHTRSPASPLQGRVMRADVGLSGSSPSPQPPYDTSAGAVGYRQSSPFVRRSSSIRIPQGGSTFVSPQQQQQTLTQLTESTSSRASSAHSTRSASMMSAAHLPNTHAKQMLERLEGATGPYLLQGLAARLKRHEAEASKNLRTL